MRLMAKDDLSAFFEQGSDWFPCLVCLRLKYETIEAMEANVKKIWTKCALGQLLSMQQQ